MANPVGRPPKYNKGILEKAYAYLEDYEQAGDVIPSIVGLALALDLHRETIHAWDREDGKKEFSDMLEKINQKQQQVLISKGLTGDFNSNITKLVLGKHGFHDKQDTEHTGKDGKPLSLKVIYE